MGRRLSLFAIALAACLGLLGATAGPAAAAGPGEAELVSLTNRARATASLRGYRYASDLSAVARRHAQRMASQQRLHHNPNVSREVSGWRQLGENVGYGPHAKAIHDAFMRSTSHRANVLDRQFAEIGVGGVVDKNGRLWVVEVFRLR